MRRIVLWALSTLSVVVLLFGYSTSTSGPDTSAQTAFVSGTTAGTSTSASTTSGTATPSTGTTSGSGSASGSGSGSGSGSTTTVTGKTVQTRWGPVQVQLTMSGTTITKVAVIQYPHDNSRDQEIASYALPQLIQETMDAQGANIDMVSGATYTSDGYVQSLQSALDQANA
jgi:uncharacterized protein with FMN-binding domain